MSTSLLNSHSGDKAVGNNTEYVPMHLYLADRAELHNQLRVINEKLDKLTAEQHKDDGASEAKDAITMSRRDRVWAIVLLFVSNGLSIAAGAILASMSGG